LNDTIAAPDLNDGPEATCRPRLACARDQSSATEGQRWPCIAATAPVSRTRVAAPRLALRFRVRPEEAVAGRGRGRGV